PLESYLNPDAPGTNPQIKLLIKHDYFEPKKSPCYLAYLKEEEETDRTNKAFGIQEWDEKDPNITGGSYFLVAFIATLRGTAPNDGFVRIGLVNKGLTPSAPNKGYFLDVNGDPMVSEIQYKSGDKLGQVMISGIVNAKGLE
ncbi:hypothetical protein MHBO_004657, partial [Bonamia ostreae]